MITCIINGMAAYPAASQSIKITYANQYVTDDGEYSYDITFPMSIMNNRRVFENVSRFDVSKNTKKYDDCKLYVDGRMVFSGIGTIISVSDTEIKLQIVGGKSRIKFNDKMAKHYIDEIDLGKATQPGTTIDKGFSQAFKDQLVINDIYKIDGSCTFVGTKGKWCFVPIRDETNNMIANFVGYDDTGNFIGQKCPYIQNVAVQPNLLYVFRKVLEYEGYKITRNDLDCEPWNNLYIASAYKTLCLNKGFPHWSCYTFIEEVRKLFNASIFFNDNNKTVQVIKSSELSTAESVEIIPIDEYNTDYDEDGTFSTSSIGNLRYNLGNAANRDEYEVISQKVFSAFELCHSTEIWGEMRQFSSTTLGWSEKQKRTTIIESYGSYYIYTEDADGNRKWTLAGIWSPLVRDSDSDDYVDLNISPAAQLVEEINFKTLPLLSNNGKENRCLLSIPNEKEGEAKEKDQDEDGYSYVSVQDAIDDESTLEDTEDEQECMNVFFVLDNRFQTGSFYTGSSLTEVGINSKWHQFLTDYRLNEECRYQGVGSMDPATWSLSLNANVNGLTTLNELQGGNIKVDNKNCLEIKFKSKDIPDPSKIYIIHNKRFVCEKIEMDIKDDQIEPICTGYFYMLS